ncbi:hypothetical protein P280DRAFT_473329, partial [Massarina eburnea CBS 473.64]
MVDAAIETPWVWDIPPQAGIRFVELDQWKDELIRYDGGVKDLNSYLNQSYIDEDRSFL